MAIEIPRQLKNKDFRFIRVDTTTKRPIDKEWSIKNNFEFDDKLITERLQNDDSVGVVGGFGNLLPIDSDTILLTSWIEDNLPKTYEVLSGSNIEYKKHFIFKTLTPKHKSVLEIVNEDKSSTHYGEIQGIGAQVIIAGCKHKSGNRYKSLNDLEIAELSDELYNRLIETFSNVKEVTEQDAKKFQTRDFKSDDIENQLNITHVFDPIGMQQNKNEFFGPHPIHGSETGMNFFINPTKNNWHCFRCNSGGGVASAIAIKEGIITCSEAGKKLSKENYKKVLDVAEKKYGFIKNASTTNEKQEIRTSFFEYPIGASMQYFEEVLTNDKKIMFVMYDSISGMAKLVPEYETSNCIYKPLDGQEVQEGYIYLPSGIIEYESDDKLEEDLKSFIRKWLDIPEDFLQYCVWEIKQSWIYDKLNTINYLRFLGDTGLGKTRALRCVGYLHYKPIVTSGASTVAPIFRIIHKWKGTLLLDELDLKMSDETADLIKLINLGYEKGNPIMRCEQNNLDNIQFFDPYCPKVISTRKPFEDKATESRCFTTVMSGTNRTNIPPNLDNDFYNEAKILRNKLLLWRLRNYEKIKIEEYKNIDLGELESRIKQTHLGLLPLFAKDEKKLEFFKLYLQKLQENIIQDRQDSFEGLIIKAFCELVFELGQLDIIPNDLITHGGFMDYRKKPAEPMKPQGINKYLKELGLGEKEEVKKVNGAAKKCIKYTKEQLKNLAKRYGYEIIEDNSNTEKQTKIISDNILQEKEVTKIK